MMRINIASHARFLCVLTGLSIGSLMPAHAAAINATLSHESGDYGSDYNYAGPRLDMTINPEGSNWYIDLGYRDREHDSNQRYTRADANISYRFRFAEGWVQPDIGIQSHTTTYDSGTRLINQLFSTETAYIYNLNDNWTLWGEVQFGLMKQEQKEGGKEGSSMKTNYLSWEIEPGVRYYFSNSSRLTVAYYNSGLRSDKGDTWNLSDDKKSQQIRFYYNWEGPYKISVSPYLRFPLGYADTSAWYDSASFDETKTKSKTSRYALQVAYPLSSTLKLQAEYYLEKTDYKSGYNMGKKDGETKYLKVGIRAAF